MAPDDTVTISDIKAALEQEVRRGIAASSAARQKAMDAISAVRPSLRVLQAYADCRLAERGGDV